MVGGYYDNEFKDHTRSFFSRIKSKEIIIIYSNILEKELQNAPDRVKNVIRKLPIESVEYLEISDEAIELAQKYIDEKVVGKISFEDCLHIALATLTRADILASWNFKHIVNVTKIRVYNSVNLKYGYPQIDIRSPRELIDYENK